MALWATLRFPLWFLWRYLFIHTFQGPKLQPRKAIMAVCGVVPDFQHVFSHPSLCQLEKSLFMGGVPASPRLLNVAETVFAGSPSRGPSAQTVERKLVRCGFSVLREGRRNCKSSTWTLRVLENRNQVCVCVPAAIVAVTSRKGVRCICCSLAASGPSRGTDADILA